MKGLGKVISLALACVISATALAACGTKPGDGAAPPAATSQAQTEAKTETATAAPDAPPAAANPYASLGLDENLRFTETRKISVEVYDRNNDGGSKPADNFYTNFIKEGMLRDHNVEVTFIPVPRWTEAEEMTNLLAAGSAPDVCVTYSYPMIQTYAGMGGVIDLAPALEETKEILPNLWGLLGERNIYWDKDPKNGTIYALEALLANQARVGTFVREDWLKALNIAEPKTLEEFHSVLKAFKDNAEKLLGADAKKMVPYGLSYDVGWRAETLIGSYFQDGISDRTRYIYGFDDRRLMYPDYKEGIRTLNKWYNEGLIWQDFAIYGAGDPTEDDMMKAGYVGAITYNWDYPYRNGVDSINANLKRFYGEDAGFIAVDPFPNNAGLYKKYVSPPIDRKVFFPKTNKEPVASLLYLDWICAYDNRLFIQYGEEGVTHETQADGSIKTIAATGDKIMNSPNNIDYMMTLNGHKLADPALTVRTLAQGFAGVDTRYIERTIEVAFTDMVPGLGVNVGTISAEDGMDAQLKEKRDNFLAQSIVASEANFDKVYDAGMKDYLTSGGQAIIDERAARWKEFYGDAEMLP